MAKKVLGVLPPLINNRGQNVTKLTLTGEIGGVDSITAGPGLLGGTITTSGTLQVSVDNSTIRINAQGQLEATGGGGSGTVTQIDTGQGLTGGPITTTGTIDVLVDGTTIDFNAAGELEVIGGGTGGVESVNGKTGIVVLSLDDLPDVSIPTGEPDDGDILVYDSSINAFEPQARGEGAIGYHGAFYDTTDQPIAVINTPQVVTINGTTLSNGISITSGSRVTIANPGTYRMSVVLQIENLSNSPEDIVVWLRLNGTDYPNSAHYFMPPARKSAGVPSESTLAFGFIGTSQNDDDYVEIWWEATSTDVSLHTNPAGSPPPVAGSVYVNINQIGYQGPQGPQGPPGAETLEELTDVDIPTGGPSDNDILVYDLASDLWKPEPAPATSPAGSNTEIQFNDNGSFGASSNLTFDGSELAVTGDVSATNGDFTTAITTPEITGNTEVTGDFTASGLLYPTSDGTSGQFIVTDGAGTLSFGDPSLDDLTDVNFVEGGPREGDYIEYNSTTSNFENVSSNELEVFLNFEEARSYDYIVPYDLTFTGFETNVSMTTSFLDGTFDYDFGNPLSKFDVLTVTTDTAGLISLTGTRGPSVIITEDLVFEVDAGNSRSYPGTGTTWIDIVNGNNGSMLNGVTYNSGDGGYMEFDGTDDQVEVGSSAEFEDFPLSIDVWFYADNAAAKNDGIVTKGITRGSANQRDWDIFGNGTNLIFAVSNGSSYIVNISDTYPATGQWHHLVCLWDGTTDANAAKMYLNGELFTEGTATNTNYANTADLYIGGNRATFYLDGRISTVKMYDRVLTAAEVRQNYNAIKDRY